MTRQKSAGVGSTDDDCILAWQIKPDEKEERSIGVLKAAAAS